MSDEGRYEMKFVTSAAVADALLADIQEFCAPDPHAGPDGGYEVSSLYYDTADLRFYWDREESVGYRRKVRLRSYNDAGKVEALCLEIKEKHKHRVAKKRAFYSNLDLLGAHPHGILSVPFAQVLSALPDGEVWRELSYLHKRFMLKPTMIIRYNRSTLVSKFDLNLRITVDRIISAGGSAMVAQPEDTIFSVLDPNLVVLEIKTNNAIPTWMQRALRQRSLSRLKFSKYCVAMRAARELGQSRPTLESEEA